MNWVTRDWRLKVLAVGLSVLMLGAVAFSQNPPTSKTLQVGITWTVPPGLIVINPPNKTTVTASGLADALTSVGTGNVSVTADLTKAAPGPSVRVNLVATSLVANIAVQTAPIALNIDQRASVKLPVVVRTPRISPGWQVTKAEARCPDSPCTVTFEGPVSWESNLKAYADFPTPVENGTYELLTQPIVLVQNGTSLDTTRTTVPAGGLDIATVTIHLEAKTGTSSRQVVLIDSPPSHPPKAGYRVTNVAVDPITVVITGSADALVKITTITLPALDLSSNTADVTFRVTITYPDGVTGSVATARVTYSISPNPNAQATPT